MESQASRYVPSQSGSNTPQPQSQPSPAPRRAGSQVQAEGARVQLVRSGSQDSEHATVPLS